MLRFARCLKKMTSFECLKGEASSPSSRRKGGERRRVEGRGRHRALKVCRCTVKRRCGGGGGHEKGIWVV